MKPALRVLGRFGNAPGYRSTSLCAAYMAQAYPDALAHRKGACRVAANAANHNAYSNSAFNSASATSE